MKKRKQPMPDKAIVEGIINGVKRKKQTRFVRVDSVPRFINDGWQIVKGTKQRTSELILMERKK